MTNIDKSIEVIYSDITGKIKRYIFGGSLRQTQRNSRQRVLVP